MGAPSTAALTDDGGLPPDPRANEGPVPGAPAWDRQLSESSSRLPSIIAHRKGYSSAHDSSITAAASASPSPGQLNQPIKDNQNRVEQPRSIPAPGHGHPGVHVEKVRHDDDGIAQAGGTTALFPVDGPSTQLKIGKCVWSGWFRTAPGGAGLIPGQDEDRRKVCPVFRAGAVGFQIGLNGASWLPALWQWVADLFQDDRYGSQLMPLLDIEIRRIIPARDVMRDEGKWARRHVCMCFAPPEGGPDSDYRRLHQHLCHAGAYAYILIMTSYGPFPFLLRAVPGSWRMLAGEVPDLAGDPCELCPGWGRVWDATWRRPYWYHWAHGSTWVRPVGRRGTGYPFPILLLARHFRHWRRLAACGGLGWTARRELCHAAFSRWLQRYLDSPAVEASFAWADFVDDDI